MFSMQAKLNVDETESGLIAKWTVKVGQSSHTGEINLAEADWTELKNLSIDAAAKRVAASAEAKV